MQATRKNKPQGFNPAVSKQTKKNQQSSQEQATQNKEMAGGLGFEPRLVESESTVLPLDDPPVKNTTEKIRRRTGSAHKTEPHLGARQ